MSNTNTMILRKSARLSVAAKRQEQYLQWKDDIIKIIDESSKKQGLERLPYCVRAFQMICNDFELIWKETLPLESFLQFLRAVRNMIEDNYIPNLKDRPLNEKQTKWVLQLKTLYTRFLDLAKPFLTT